jgi:hypothetical protein
MTIYHWPSISRHKKSYEKQRGKQYDYKDKRYCNIEDPLDDARAVIRQAVPDLQQKQSTPEELPNSSASHR